MPIRLCRAALIALAAIAPLVAGCGGAKGDQEEASDDAGKATIATSFDASSITPQELALGDSLFHGLIGATSCQACHGPEGKGGVVAPDLTDTLWLHSDGSFEAIHKQIETGVAQPKQYSSMMPPFGGAPLTPEKHRAVSAYVYTLSHPAGK
jgi:mono/diheme cytochrome c family protein